MIEPVLGWNHLESKGSKAVVTKRRLIGWSHSRKAERGSPAQSQLHSSSMKAIVVLENNFLIIIWSKKGPHYYDNIAVMMELCKTSWDLQCSCLV